MIELSPELPLSISRQLATWCGKTVYYGNYQTLYDAHDRYNTLEPALEIGISKFISAIGKAKHEY
jgi:hypothetical protein